MIVELGLSGAPDLLLWQDEVLIEFLGAAASIAVLLHRLDQGVQLLVVKEGM